MPTVRARGRELHLDRGYTAILLTLEIREVPSRRNKIGPHALDCMHEHTGAFDGLGLPLANNHARRIVARPEAVHDVPVSIFRIVTEVRKSALWTLANLPPWCRCRTGDIQGYLEIIRDVSTDRIRFWRLRSRVGLVDDGELI